MENEAAEKVIRSLFSRFYEELEKAGVLILSTIKISVDFTSGNLSLSDNEETIISEEIIYAWALPEEERADESRFRKRAEEVREYLRRLVETLAHEGYFERPIFQTPFAVLLGDLSGGKSKPIYKIDGGWTVMDKPLLKGWERDLSGFASRLFGEPNPKTQTRPNQDRNRK